MDLCIHDRIAGGIEFCLNLVGIFIIFGLIGFGQILSDDIIPTGASRASILVEISSKKAYSYPKIN